MMKEGGHYIKANKEDTNKMEHGVDCGSDDSADSDALQLFELLQEQEVYLLYFLHYFFILISPVLIMHA